MADYPDLETMTRELWDREQIRQVKFKNMRHLDLKQWDEMALTFTEDCTTSWVNGDISLQGRDAIMDFLKSTPFSDGDAVVHIHQCTSMEIEFTGPGEATTVSRLYNPMHHKDGNGMHLLLSFYRDRFRRVEGQWLICHTGHEYLYDEFWARGELEGHQQLYRHPF